MHGCLNKATLTTVLSLPPPSFFYISVSSPSGFSIHLTPRVHHPHSSFPPTHSLHSVIFDLWFCPTILSGSYCPVGPESSLSPSLPWFFFYFVRLVIVPTSLCPATWLCVLVVRMCMLVSLCLGVCGCGVSSWLPGRLDSPFLRQQHSPSPTPLPRGASPLRTLPQSQTQPAAAAGRYSP